MPDDALLRATLRDEWHLVPSEIVELPATVMSRGWEVTSGGEHYVVRLADAAARQSVEAGLMAVEHLRAAGMAAGEPMRTLGGALTVLTAACPACSANLGAPAGTLAVLRRVPGRRLDGRDPVDQHWWGERLGAAHRALQGFRHPGLRPWQPPDPDAPHLTAEPWLRTAVCDAVTAATRLTVTDRLTYGVLHGDPAPGAFVVDSATGCSGLLHCGASGTGPLAYDVAAAVAYAGGPERGAELLAAYRAAGAVDGDELDAALPVLLRLCWAVQAYRAARAGRAGALRRARLALEAMSG